MLNKYLNITNQTNKIFISDYGSRNVLRVRSAVEVAGDVSLSSSQDSNAPSAPDSKTSEQMITALKDQNIKLQDILGVYKAQSLAGAISSNSSQENTVTGKFNKLKVILSSVSSSLSSATTSTDPNQAILQATLEKIIDEQYQDFTIKNPSLTYGKKQETIKELFKDHSANFFLETLEKLSTSNEYKDDITAEELLYQFKFKYSKFLNSNQNQSLMRNLLTSGNYRYHVNAEKFIASIYDDLISTMDALSISDKKEKFNETIRKKLLEKKDGVFEYRKRTNFAYGIGIIILLLGLVATTGLFLGAAFMGNIALVGGALSLPAIYGITTLLAFATVAVAKILNTYSKTFFGKKQITAENLPTRMVSSQKKINSSKYFTSTWSQQFSPLKDLFDKPIPKAIEAKQSQSGQSGESKTYVFNDDISLEESLYELSRLYRGNESADIKFSGSKISSERQEIMKSLAKTVSSIDNKDQAKETIVKNFTTDYYEKHFKQSPNQDSLELYRELANCFQVSSTQVASPSEKKEPKLAFKTALSNSNFIKELQQHSSDLYKLLDSRYIMPELSLPRSPVSGSDAVGAGADQSGGSSLPGSGGSSGESTALPLPPVPNPARPLAQPAPAQSGPALPPALPPAQQAPASARLLAPIHSAPVENPARLSPPAQPSDRLLQPPGGTIMYVDSQGGVPELPQHAPNPSAQFKSDLQSQMAQQRLDSREPAGGAFEFRLLPGQGRFPISPWLGQGDHGQEGLYQEPHQPRSAQGQLFQQPPHLQGSADVGNEGRSLVSRAQNFQASTRSVPQLRLHEPDDTESYVEGAQPLELDSSQTNPHGAGQHGSPNFAPFHPGTPMPSQQRLDALAQHVSSQGGWRHDQFMVLEESHGQHDPEGDTSSVASGRGAHRGSPTLGGHADRQPPATEGLTVQQSPTLGGHAHRQPPATEGLTYRQLPATEGLTYRQLPATEGLTYRQLPALGQMGGGFGSRFDKPSSSPTGGGFQVSAATLRVLPGGRRGGYGGHESSELSA